MTPVSRADRAPLALRVSATVVGVCFLAPVVYVVWRAVALDADVGEILRESAGPLWRTVQLAVLVSLATGILGTTLAWLLIRTDIPLARVWRLLVMLPLVFPSFVGAAAYLAGLGPDGVLRAFLDAVGVQGPDRFRGLWASVFVLTAFTYPYVHLPVAARLAALPPSIEESARLLGDRPLRLFFRIVFPAIRSSVLGGMLIVCLYSLSEFGAVQLLAYDTLTRVVYATRLLDRAQSFAAAGLLVVLALVAVALERRLGASLRTTAPQGMRRSVPLPIGGWRWPAAALVVGVLLVALVAPLASLAQWAWRGIAQGANPIAQLGSDLAGLAGPSWSTAWIGSVAALVTIPIVLSSAVVTARYRSRLSPFVTGSILCGFAVPGLVIALSLAFWALNVPLFDRLYQSAALLIAAYVIHFGAQAVRPSEVAVASVSGHVRESARLLGASPLRRVLTVDLPMIRPGLIAGAGLVLLSTVKELPATLLLAPIGVQTLSTKIWGAFESGFLAQAGLASITLLVVSGALTWVLVLRRSERLS